MTEALKILSYAIYFLYLMMTSCGKTIPLHIIHTITNSWYILQLFFK